MHLDHPVMEAVADEGPDDRVIAIEGIAAAGEVLVVALVLVQHVVDAVVEAAKAYAGPELVPLGGMVEYDIEYHFDARPVKGAHHLLEFGHLLATEPEAEYRPLGAKKASSNSPSSSTAFARSRDPSWGSRTGRIPGPEGARGSSRRGS